MEDCCEGQCMNSVEQSAIFTVYVADRYSLHCQIQHPTFSLYALPVQEKRLGTMRDLVTQLQKV